MSGYTRISASLILTLVVWLPMAISSVQHDRVDSVNTALRFLIVFTLARTAMRGIDRLIRVYTERNGTMVAKGNPPFDVTGLSLVADSSDIARRRTDLSEGGNRVQDTVDPLDVGHGGIQPARSDR